MNNTLTPGPASGSFNTKTTKLQLNINDSSIQQLVKYRITSIDLLRGIVMIIMALDHTRDYFHKYSFLHDPTDLEHTSPWIFFTRFITHYCAPVFIFLAGTSAFLIRQRKSKADLSRFLFKRGVWLMILEVTVVGFAWFFNPKFNLMGLQVIWVLGVCMIALSLMIHLPVKAILVIGFVMVFGHNLLDSVHVPGNTLAGFGWSQLHEFNVYRWSGLTIFAAYPMIPWIGVMGLGYCMGTLYQPSFDIKKRKQILLLAGLVSVFLFIIIRYINMYGDTQTWSVQPTSLFTFLSFLNTVKYPPSLLFLLMTLGPGLIFLSVSENWRGKLSQILSTYGRVPLFYYIVHVYVLHLAGLITAEFSGFDWRDMIFDETWITLDPDLKGYGFSLPVVYLIWIATVIAFYPLCKWYDRYKQRNKEKWWLSYL